MKDEKLYFVMDDTNNHYDFDDLAAFEATLDAAALSEHRKKADAIAERFFGKEGRRKRTAA